MSVPDVNPANSVDAPRAVAPCLRTTEPGLRSSPARWTEDRGRWDSAWVEGAPEGTEARYLFELKRPFGQLGLQVEPAVGEELLSRVAGAMALWQAPLSFFGPFMERVLELLMDSTAIAPRASRPIGRLEVSRLPSFLEELCLARACASHPRDERAWCLLSRMHAPRLVAQARVMGSSHPEDEVHDLFLDLWLPSRTGRSLIHSYAGRAPLGPWLALVLRRRLSASRRKLARHRGLADSLDRRDPMLPSAADLVAHEEELKRIGNLVSGAMDELSARDRDLIESRYLRVELGKSTAERWGVSPSFVSKRCRQVLAILRGRLRPLVDQEAADALEA